MSGESLQEPLTELRFALAEASSTPPPPALWTRVRERSLSRRPLGRPLREIDHINGAEVFGRSVLRLQCLLNELEPLDWGRPARRGLDVQGLIGHLIGVEQAFHALLDGDETLVAAGHHIESTQAHAMAQAGRPRSETLGEWAAMTGTTAVRLAERQAELAPWYGISLPLDDLLVVRSFEIWIHEEDVRRATDRPLIDPDEESLSRMTELAVRPLAGGLAPEEGIADPLRLVLTGPGGATWDLFGAQPTPSARGVDASRVVLGAGQFCRIVANRIDPEGAGAIISGPAEAAETLFAVAAALALD